MKKKLITTTGYSPKYSNYHGTANEQLFYETSAEKGNLSAYIKDNTLIIEDYIYDNKVNCPPQNSKKSELPEK